MNKGSWLLVMYLLVSFSLSSETLTCGIAEGYPPYQFKISSEVTGLDADLARLIFSEIGEEFVFLSGPWDDVFNQLRFGQIDFITGMEINPVRTRYFEFSDECYKRYDAIFILEENEEIQSVSDLYRKTIAGDRHSLIELQWEKQGIYDSFRIFYPVSKEESLSFLVEKKADAVIMPVAVGFWLAEKMQISVRILEQSEEGTSVAVAVRKENFSLVDNINKALHKLKNTGKLDELYKKWKIKQ